ncbi:MAG: hypothetical protein H6719_16975 [Sandaracinaceae bacterium]|nr:hypothetical protein [Sandaracinaceae bacterium]
MKPRLGRAPLFLASLTCVLGACMAGRAPGLWASSVTYALHFDRAGVSDLPDGGFSTTTAEGLEVRLHRGYLLQSSLTLVDCLGVGGDAWDDYMASLLTVPLARAGHTGSADPSELIRPRFLDLATADGDLEFGTVTMPEARYCRVHHLVAGSYDEAAIEGPLPEGVDPILTTLVLEGEWRSAGGDWAAFDARSTLSSGALHDLPDVLEGGLDGSHATVTVSRDLARMFDGVDFDAEPERTVLRNLVVDAPVAVRVDPEE